MNGTDHFADEIATRVAEKLNALPRVAKRLFTMAEAAEYTGLTEDAIRRKVSQRKIPFVKIDRFSRFDKQDLDRWIEENRQYED